jgi:poly-gamma-glutamate synthesis protein (capsule biosynthesis protein)
LGKLACSRIPGALVLTAISTGVLANTTNDTAPPTKMRGSFTVSSVGDLINADPLDVEHDAEARRLAQILRSSDVAIGNQESTFFDIATFPGPGPGSPYILLGRPTLAKGLNALGIEMVSTASNHSNDWGVEGLIAMTRLLDAAGIVHAGDGMTLAEARAPRFLRSSNGRVALIAAASTYKQGAKAQDAIDGVPARPGINGLRVRPINIVSAGTMRHLRAVWGRKQEPGDLVVSVDTPFAQPIEKRYRAGPHPRVIYDMNVVDHDEILDAIRAGKREADVAVFTLHAHENADNMDDLAPGPPADFLVRLFHDAVNAGADVVMGGGPHSMRGIEIYRGKPIFYGLGVFLFGGNVVLTQEQQTERYEDGAQRDSRNPKDRAFKQPESWNEGFIAMTHFEDGKLREVRLQPLDRKAGNGTRLATPVRAREILARLQNLSRPFGTVIAIDGATGIIRP